MNQQDIIMLSVVGTNGSTRQQRTIATRFNGLGEELNNQGQPVVGGARLRGLPTGASASAPSFPIDSYTTAIGKGTAGAAEARAILQAHEQKVAAWEKESGGGATTQVASAALLYLKEVHDFSIEADDSKRFVVKRENIDVSVQDLPDGRSLYTVAGTAVFG